MTGILPIYPCLQMYDGHLAHLPPVCSFGNSAVICTSSFDHTLWYGGPYSLDPMAEAQVCVWGFRTPFTGVMYRLLEQE